MQNEKCKIKPLLNYYFSFSITFKFIINLIIKTHIFSLCVFPAATTSWCACHFWVSAVHFALNMHNLLLNFKQKQTKLLYMSAANEWIPINTANKRLNLLIFFVNLNINKMELVLLIIFNKLSIPLIWIQTGFVIYIFL